VDLNNSYICKLYR